MHSFIQTRTKVAASSSTLSSSLRNDFQYTRFNRFRWLPHKGELITSRQWEFHYLCNFLYSYLFLTKMYVEAIILLFNLTIFFTSFIAFRQIPKINAKQIVCYTRDTNSNKLRFTSYLISQKRKLTDHFI